MEITSPKYNSGRNNVRYAKKLPGTDPVRNARICNIFYVHTKLTFKLPILVYRCMCENACEVNKIAKTVSSSIGLRNIIQPLIFET